MAIIPMAKVLSAMTIIQSSIEAAAKSERNWFTGYVVWLVVAALVTGFFTVLVYLKTGRTQEAITDDANARIAEAGDRASQADARAAQANEKAGTANERAEKLESANLSLRAQVATLETQAADAKKDVADLQKAAANAVAAQQRVQTELAKQQTLLASQQERAAKAEKALLELQQHLAQRAFTNERALIQALAATPVKPRIPVLTVDDAEAIAFAQQIIRILTAAGWDTNRTPAIASPAWEGIVLSVNDEKSLPASAILLIEEFGHSGFRVTPFGRGDTDGPILFNLRIGTRPRMR